MSNEFQDLQSKWKAAKKSNDEKQQSTHSMLQEINAKRKSGLRFQYGNLVILGITLLALIVVFVVLFRFKERISQIAISLMIAGIAARVLTEIISVQKSKQIDMGGTALEALQKSESYLSFRKKVHGPVTFWIVAVYTVCYYAILPELSLYFDQRIIIFWAIIYVVGAVILVSQVRKAIRKELTELKEIVELKKDILQKEEGE